MSLRHVPLLALLTVGCFRVGKPDEGSRFVPPDQVTEFAILFRRHCAGCHGTDGRLGPAPLLNDRLFLQIVPQEELHRVIRSGRPGTPMPAFQQDQGGMLTAEQVASLARGLPEQWGGPVGLQGAPSYFPKPGVVGDRDRGGKIFARACAICHGDHGQGGTWGGYEGGALVGAINDPAFLVLVSDQFLRRTIIVGRPDLDMPDYQDFYGRGDDFRPLSDQDVTDLVALLASWRASDRN
ncbi:MAG: c-type cytochrome [Gemmataceae bacterium]|nr:c-type cytochrome [Gemmataceae bacterium]MDW8264955.1 c-type cytochrome [Gemmataceae bacterium]